MRANARSEECAPNASREELFFLFRIFACGKSKKEFLRVIKLPFGIKTDALFSRVLPSTFSASYISGYVNFILRFFKRSSSPEENVIPD